MNAKIKVGDEMDKKSFLKEAIARNEPTRTRLLQINSRPTLTALLCTVNKKWWERFTFKVTSELSDL